MVFKVTLGCTVTGRVGPLVYARPDAKNRSRIVFEGTVVETVPNNLWKVYWHDMQLTATDKPKELKFVAARKSNCSDEQLKVLCKNVIYVGDKEDISMLMLTLPVLKKIQLSECYLEQTVVSSNCYDKTDIIIFILIHGELFDPPSTSSPFCSTFCCTAIIYYKFYGYK